MAGRWWGCPEQNSLPGLTFPVAGYRAPPATPLCARTLSSIDDLENNACRQRGWQWRWISLLRTTDPPVFGACSACLGFAASCRQFAVALFQQPSSTEDGGMYANITGLRWERAGVPDSSAVSGYASGNKDWFASIFQKWFPSSLTQLRLAPSGLGGLTTAKENGSARVDKEKLAERRTRNLRVRLQQRSGRASESEIK